MKRLTILTPDPAEARYNGRWHASFARLEAAFQAVGVEAEPAPWIDRPADADAALAVLSWGYHHQLGRWLERLSAGGPPLINTAKALRWNTRKTYLLGLEAAGVPIVPTRALVAGDEAAVASAFADFACDTLVVKPQVSAGSHLIVRLTRGEPCPELPAGPVLIQPFLSAIGEEGELSLFYFGGRFSHGARKIAAEGDFRIQPQFGGRFSRLEPDGEAVAAAECALAAAPAGITYARIDLIRRGDGRLALMELEAIEPDLYLDLEPAAADRFAQAVVSAMRS